MKIATRDRQKGAALIIGMVVLLVMTIIGLSGISTSHMETVMAGNKRSNTMALEAAERGLRDAEAFLQTVVNVGAIGGGGGEYGQAEAEPDYFAEATWDPANSLAYSGAPIAGVDQQPRYIVKYIGTVVSAVEKNNAEGGGAYGNTLQGEGTPMFKVTVRGYGSDPNSKVLIQSYFGI